MKTNKKRNQVKNDSFKVNWLSRSQIIEILENNAMGKEQILPRTLQKWDPLENISDSKTIVVDIKHKYVNNCFNHFQYLFISLQKINI